MLGLILMGITLALTFTVPGIVLGIENWVLKAVVGGVILIVGGSLSMKLSGGNNNE